MTKKRVKALAFHYKQFIADKPTVAKKLILEKLKRQANKYSGARGETILLKIALIKEEYPEVLI